MYNPGKYIYDFQQYETKRSFGETIYTGIIIIAEEDQSNLLQHSINFNNKSRPKNIAGKDKKISTFDSASALYEGRELALNPKTVGEDGVRVNLTRPL